MKTISKKIIPKIAPVVHKTVQKAGTWITKVTKTQVLVCVCGAKYLKTRPDQIVCVKCIYKGTR